MTTSLVNALQNKISAEKNNFIRNFLLSHINPTANDLTDLFTAKHPYRRQTNLEGRASYQPAEDLPYNHLINLVYAYAPEEVCDELTTYILQLPAEEFYQLLATRLIAFDEKSDERVMHTLTHYAPVQHRNRIFEKVVMLTDKQKADLLFITEESLSKRKLNFLDLITTKTNESNHEIMLILCSLSVDTRYEFYKSFSLFGFKEAYTTITDFFLKNTHEPSSLLMIALLNEHTVEQLKNLVFRNNDDDHNLLQAIVKKQSASVVLKTVQLLKQKLSVRTLKRLLTETTPDSKESVLEIAARRTDDPHIAANLFHELSAVDDLKNLLTDVSFTNPTPVIHIAAKLGNTLALTSVIENHIDIDNQANLITRENIKDIAEDNQDVQRLLANQAIYHYAAEFKGHFEEIRALILANPECVENQWDNGKTLLHIAAEAGNIPLMTLLLDLDVDLLALDKDNLTALDHALLANQSATIPLFFQKPAIYQLIPSVLGKLKISGQRERLQQILCSSHPPFQAALNNYCLETHDTALVFLTEISHLLNNKSHDDLFPTLFEFVNQRLAQLNEPIFFSNARLQLISLLFTSKPLLLTRFLEQTKCPQRASEIAAVMEYALQQPAIFMHLPSTDFQQYLALLNQYSPKADKTWTTLLNYYFVHPEVNQLSIKMLHYFAQNSTVELLQNCYRKTHNPILLILLLNKILDTQPVDEAQLHFSINELITVLKNYNQNADELALLLNLAIHPQLHNALEKIIAALDNSPISNTLQTLFSHFNRSNFLAENSFLRKLFINLASNFDRKNPKVYQQILAITNEEETKTIFDSLTNHCRKQVATINQSEKSINLGFDDENHEFTTWLLSRKKQALRQKLLVYWNEIDLKKNELEKLSDQVELDSYLSLFNETISLLEKLSIDLYQIYRHLDKEAWSQSLENQLTQLSYKFKEIQEASAHLAQESPVKKCLNDVCNFEELRKTIKQTCLSIYENELLLNQSASQNTESIIAPVKQLSLHLQRAAFERISDPFFFNQFCRWFIDFSSFCPEKDFYFYLLAALNNGMNFDILKPILSQQQQRLDDNLLLLNGLQVLMLNQDVSPYDLTKFFCQYSLTQLNEFKHLCVNGNCQDISLFIDNIIAAKREAIPTAILLSSHFLPNVTNVKSWLQANLTRISAYSQRISSVKLFFIGAYCEHDHLEPRLLNLAQHLVNEKHQDLMTSDAIIQLISSYTPALTKHLFSATEQQLFIQCIHHLLNKKSPEVIDTILANLPPQMVTELVDCCIDNLSTVDKTYALACRQLLTYLCQQHEAGQKQQLQYLKNRLGAQDLHILKDNHLISLAQDILSDVNEDDLQQQTINGIWIQRLLTTPRFVAACPPEALTMLAERYRLISLTLKQDEFERLNAVLKNKMNFYDFHHKAQFQAHLAAKRQRLLQFRADDSVRALFVQLEENCFDLRKTHEKSIAESALHHLYAHYSSHLAGLRNDYLFKISHFLWSISVGQKGDLQKTEDTLAFWLNRYLPHHNFTQQELINKQTIFLYNQQGEKIAFLNDAGQVMVLLDEPCPILSVIDTKGQPLYKEGYLFYQANGRECVGTLSANGKLKRENLFQEQTSAMLLATVPTDQLTQSPAVVELLIQDVFSENELATVFENAEQDKHDWLQQQIYTQLANYNHELSRDCFTVLVNQQAKAQDLFQTLAYMQHRYNAAQLFHAILLDKTLRQQLFSPEGQHYLFQFLQNHDAVEIFAGFLEQDFEHDVYLAGFKAFANYAQSVKHPHLLGNSLARLSRKSTLSDAQYDKILTRLLASNESAEIIWTGFLNADRQTSIQHVDSGLTHHFTQFFYKHHCQTALEQVNQHASWSNNYQYRLLLTLFHHQHDQIFNSKELRYSEKQAWTELELQQLCQWTKRHLNETNLLDLQQGIGKRLLSELVFRTANFGNTQLFYTNQRFDFDMAYQTMKRSIFHAVISMPIVGYVLDKIDNGWQTFKDWLTNKPLANEQQKILEQLQSEQAFIDWQAISDSTWLDSKSQEEMPLITAYLFNYSGLKSKLNSLISNYLEKGLQKPAIILALIDVLNKLPQRDVSLAIFENLEQFYTLHPRSLSPIVFSALAQFYCRHAFPEEKFNSPQTELRLIEHFGQQKKYHLVKQCCRLLHHERYKTTLDGTHKKLLSQISTEAKVEADLQSQLGKFYFFLLKLFKRYFNYQHNDVSKSSKILLFCDDARHYESPIKAPNFIESTIKSGQMIAHEIAVNKKRLAFKERIKPFMEKFEKEKLTPACKETVIAVPQEVISSTSCGFFDRNQLQRETVNYFNSPVPS